MKRFLSLLMMFAALSFAFAGCDKLGDIFGNDDDDEQNDGYGEEQTPNTDTDLEEGGTITLSAGELLFPAEGGALTVEVIPSKEDTVFEIENVWQLQEWLDIDIDGFTVTFTAHENPFAIERETEALFVTRTPSEPVVLRLWQDRSGFVEARTRSTFISSRGGIVEFEVETNTDFHIEIPDEAAAWISFDGTRAERIDTVRLNIAANDGNAPRNATVRIVKDALGEYDGEWQDEVYVAQSAPCFEIHYTTNDGLPLNNGGANSDFSNDGQYVYEQRNLFNDGAGTLVFSGPVTKIGEDAFMYCKNLESIEIPEGVTEIESSAFFDCPALKSVEIPQTVEAIGYIAFNQCTGLEAFHGKFASEDGRCLVIDRAITAFAGAGLDSYTTPDEAVEIEIYAFYMSPDLRHLTVAESVKAIRHDAFEDCASLETVTLPETLRILEHRAFSGCGKLQSVNIPSAIEEIDFGMFSGCSSLVEITIPDTVTAISSSVFSDCTSLESIVIPEGVTQLESALFSGCSSLKSVVMSDKVEYFGKNVFLNCTSLEHIDLPSKLRYISEGTFGGCTSLKSIAIPGSVSRIDDNAFEGCTSLKEIDTANTESIWGEAFLRCTSLETVTLGPRTKKVYENAFKGCTSLKTVRSLATTPPELEYNAFYEPALETIYVPEESFEAYMTDKTWLDYRGFIHIDE